MVWFFISESFKNTFFSVKNNEKYLFVFLCKIDHCGVGRIVFKTNVLSRISTLLRLLVFPSLSLMLQGRGTQLKFHGGPKYVLTYLKAKVDVF